MWAMYGMGVQHYIYMWKIGVVRGEKRYWGYAYMVFFGIWTFIKFALDLINVCGGDLGRFDGIVALAYIADFMFDFSLVGCPPFIYLLFIDELDVVRLSVTVTEGMVEHTSAKSNSLSAHDEDMLTTQIEAGAEKES